MKARQKNLLLFFGCLIAVLILYGRSLSYNFVYDDRWRLSQNPQVQSLSNVFDFFVEPEKQSSYPELNKHTYRPLLAIHFMLDYQFWGQNPAGYRLVNLIFHALNGFLIILLASRLFRLSTLGAVLSGGLFLVHPLQVESVVWISQRSNILCLTFMLLGLLCWVKKLKMGTALCFALGLFIREVMVVFPAVLVLTDLYQNPRTKWRARLKKEGRFYALFFGITILFFFWRGFILGQVSQAPFWGGTWVSNLGNVARFWPLYLVKLIWPLPQSVGFYMTPSVSFFEPKNIPGLLLLIGTIVFLVKGFKKKSPAWYGVSLFVLFWLPGSNLIPVNIQFAERFFYPMMVPVSFLFGLAMPKKVAFAFLGFFLVLQQLYLPVWRNDFTLWKHVVHVYPNFYFQWFCLGFVQFERGETDVASYDAAETSFKQALKLGAPSAQAGELFYWLVQVNVKQGKWKDAKEHARRAKELRPDLSSRLDHLLNEKSKSS